MFWKEGGDSAHGAALFDSDEFSAVSYWVTTAKVTMVTCRGKSKDKRLKKSNAYRCNELTVLAPLSRVISYVRSQSCHDSSLIFTLESIKSVVQKEVISCEDRTRILSSCSVLTQRICDR
ncbi:hypothetical protein F2Q68_00017876 [Brassica cretica]|uniref:Uncharacterized protein n=1 Tax=Brassica cretica TaxID=69181 RepID=A0A8S9HFK7_BRACR|nr:hypothetical protein F2Q68_00017876 [Brassica cretica]